MKRVLFMKVGWHARELWPEILGRKMTEEKLAGFSLWGYSSTICHPRTQVLPFVLSAEDPVTVVMTVIKSASHMASWKSYEYGIPPAIPWTPIPNAIEVRGSKYALVLDTFRAGEGVIDLSRYRVAAGPKAGLPATGYIRSRIDKGCLSRDEGLPRSLPLSFPIHFTARLRPPYAVLVR
jgi:hypothetical protein